MQLSYTLIPGGFTIQSDDGRIKIHQPYAPEGPGFRPLGPLEAAAAAEALIAEIQAAQAAENFET